MAGHRIIRRMGTPTGPQRRQLRFCKAFFEVREPAALGSLLTEAGAIELGTGGEGAPMDAWYLWEEPPTRPGVPRARFVIRLRDRRLVLEGPTAASVGRGWRALDRQLRPAAVARVAAGDDLGRFLPAKRKHSADRPESWSREHERKVLREFYSVFCRRWATTPHRRLAEKTPLQASKDERLRPELLALLERMEAIEEKRRDRGMQTFSVDDLRRTVLPSDDDAAGADTPRREQEDET